MSPVPLLHQLRERVEIECSDRGGGGLSSGGLLPGSLSRLVEVLTEAQEGEFEILTHAVDRNGAMLNVPPPPTAPLLPQPLARLVVQAHERAALPNLCGYSGGELPASVERLVSAGGALYVVGA